VDAEPNRANHEGKFEMPCSQNPCDSSRRFLPDSKPGRGRKAWNVRKAIQLLGNHWELFLSNVTEVGRAVKSPESIR
jgi:hypothetical protein